MKKFMLILLLCASVAWPISPPTILQIQSGIETAVIPNYPYARLTFKNNVVGTTSFIVFRRDTTEPGYTMVAIVPGTATTIVTEVPKYSMKYYYVMWGIAGTDTSGPSNMDSVFSPSKINFFKAPFLSEPQWDSVSKSVKITYIDSSNCETGYRIYKKNSMTMDSARFDFPSQNSNYQGKVEWIDTAVAANNWYTYRVEAYRDLLLRSTDDKMVYSLTFKGLIDSNKPVYELGNKLSDFPVNYGYKYIYQQPYPGAWAIKPGDSIFIREINAPDSVCSVIDFRNPQSPQFLGVEKQFFPTKSYSPISRGKGTAFFGVGVSGGNIDYFSISNQQLQKADGIGGINFAREGDVPSLQIVNDSLVFFLCPKEFSFIEFGKAGTKRQKYSLPGNQGYHKYVNNFKNIIIFSHYYDDDQLGYVTRYYVTEYNSAHGSLQICRLSDTMPKFPDIQDIGGFYVHNNDNLISIRESGWDSLKADQFFVDTSKKVISILYRYRISTYELVPASSGIERLQNSKSNLFITINQKKFPSRVSIQLPATYNPSLCEITVYSLLGRRLLTVPIDKTGRAVWNTSRQARGAYVMRIEQGNRSLATRMMLIK